jgi:hypothetical protein
MSSWIDDALDAAAVRRLFADVLAARDDLGRHAALPPPGPDPAVASYWRPRRPAGLGESARPMFDTAPADTAADRLGDALRALWSQASPEHPDGLPELVALVPQFTTLAARLRAGQAAGNPTAGHGTRPRPVETVPALIYPMF